MTMQNTKHLCSSEFQGYISWPNLTMVLETNENVAETDLVEVKTLVAERHYNSARQKLVKMQSLYPSVLDQIESMLTLSEVLSAADLSRPGCSVDHYWVLNVSPFHRLSSITVNYNRILNSLRPLKTEIPATTMAIELVEKAFSVISDQLKRSRFDNDRKSGWDNHFQDYHNFERDREWPNCAEEGQIWAADFRTSMTLGYKYGRVSFPSKEAVRVNWLKPIPISGSERSWCESGLPVSCGKFELDCDTASDLSWPGVPSFRCDWVRGALDHQFEIYPRRSEVWAIYKDWNIDEWADCGSDRLKQCRFELIEIVSDFSKYLGAQCAYLEKVDGFKCVFQRKKIQGLDIRPGIFYKLSHKVPAHKFTGGEITGVTEGMFELDRVALPDHLIIHNDETTTTTTTKIESSRKNLPKPCFTAKDFSAGQIWTVCNVKDRMPRQYARIDRAISESKVCVTLLEPLISHNQWGKENLPTVSGVFKVRANSVIVDMSRFSYVVQCRQISDPFYEIHPMKGEVWAMYKNWNKEWKQSDYEAYECQVVLILSDSSEGEGTKVARLEVVKGYLTFFQRQQCDGFDLTGIVTESLSFSHRIPAFRVPGIVRHGIRETAWHLEPSALPPIRKASIRV